MKDRKTQSSAYEGLIVVKHTKLTLHFQFSSFCLLHLGDERRGSGWNLVDILSFNDLKTAFWSTFLGSSLIWTSAWLIVYDVIGFNLSYNSCCRIVSWHNRLFLTRSSLFGTTVAILSLVKTWSSQEKPRVSKAALCSRIQYLFYIRNQLLSPLLKILIDL